MNVLKVVGIVRRVLTALTNIKDSLPLPRRIKEILQGGRDQGLWSKKPGIPDKK